MCRAVLAHWFVVAIYTYLQDFDIILTDRRISPSENVSFRIFWNSFELFGILLNS